jgi:hypothetical protein
MVDTTGWSVRNKANPYFAKANHVKLAKNQATKRFLDSVVDQFLVVRALLFSDDEPGVFYDFDDWSTLFQDTAGTQPVTAANQGVALALDKRLGLELGPELVTNGTFDSDTSGWTGERGAVLSFVDGRLRVAGSGTTFPYAAQGISVIAGKSYKIRSEATFVSGVEGQTRFEIATLAASGATLFSSSGDEGSKEFIFTPTTTQTVFVRLLAGETTTSVAEWDNISVRELKGNHATQATTAARPLTAIHPDGGVRNLLDRSEELDGSAWSKSSGATVTGGVLDPLGGTSAFRLVSPNIGSGIFQTVVEAPAGPRIVSVWLRSNDAGWQFTLTGTFAGISVTSDWQFYTFTGDSGDLFSLRNALGGDREIDIWHPQFELGSTPTPYQRRVNFLDVTEAGKRSIRRLYFNGTSHFMTTPTITPNTDKAQVFAGVRKLSDAADATLFMHAGDEGRLQIDAPGSSTAAKYQFISRGTQSAVPFTSSTIFNAPISNVVTALGDISGPLAALRLDGNAVATVTATQGTVNYASEFARIGARTTAAPSQFFNGYIDQLITRFGTNLATGAIETTEKYVSTKVPELVAASEVTWNASTDTYTQNLVGLGR